MFSAILWLYGFFQSKYDSPISVVLSLLLCLYHYALSESVGNLGQDICVCMCVGCVCVSNSGIDHFISVPTLTPEGLSDLQVKSG